MGPSGSSIIHRSSILLYSIISSRYCYDTVALYMLDEGATIYYNPQRAQMAQHIHTDLTHLARPAKFPDPPVYQVIFILWLTVGLLALNLLLFILYRPGFEPANPLDLMRRIRCFPTKPKVLLMLSVSSYKQGHQINRGIIIYNFTYINSFISYKTNYT